MFSLCEEPLRLTEAGIHGLCLSLNTPVLNIADLPVGPARAAVVLHEVGDGTLELAVGIRSIETRQVAVYACRGTARALGAASLGLERATRFGEQMGFLFDESVTDRADAGASARALGLWHDVAGGVELSDSTRPEGAEAAVDASLSASGAAADAAAPEELLLDEPVADREEAVSAPAEEELWLDELTEPGPLLVDSPEQPIPLAKFRRSPSPPVPRGAEAGAEDRAPAGALGRIALVRRGGESRRPGPLLRLLGNF